MPKSAGAASKTASKLTPMLRHYLQVKAEVPDAILLYRMGDFYELFFEDAVEAAPVLEVQLTARQKGTPSEAPMCGVPHHSIDGYIAKLLETGRKVAVCDQVEDPKQAQGLVKREITRILSPGTLSDLELLDRETPNYLLALGVEDGRPVGALLELSTGHFFGRRWEGFEDLQVELEARSVTEVLLLQSLEQSAAERLEAIVARVQPMHPDQIPGTADAERELKDQFQLSSLQGLGLQADDPLAVCAAVAIRYARRNSFSDLPHIRHFQIEADEDAVVLDESTLRNLEITKSASERRKHGSLLWSIDRTVTAGGGRRIREWLLRPLRSIEAIENRLDAVEELQRKSLREPIREALASVHDLERLTTRAVLGQLTPPEAAALREGLDGAPGLLELLSNCSCQHLVQIAKCDPCADLADFLGTWLAVEPAASLRTGGVIADGADAELDRLRTLGSDAKKLLLELEQRERDATGISSLKVRFNKVFGYYLEVTKANQHLVPEHYVRKQTLANAERYITDELKRLEDEILGAEERQLELEAELFETVRRRIASDHQELRSLAAALSRLDVFAGFAEVAAARGYQRPAVVQAGEPLEVSSGRHPVVERTVEGDFVPNDVRLGVEAGRILLVTGPNMGGKSTYLRQVALIAILAHCGSFVPAESARVPLLDRVFTRVGASDNLARGESTFMVEMSETANILRYATPDSLVILDEVGRGTATFDGLSIAWAIVEHLHEITRCKTLFATHYHELTELAAELDGLENRAIAVREWEDRIIFLHRVVPGAADQSYGIQVGKLAGLPAAVIQRAQEVLSNLEADTLDPVGKPKRGAGSLSPEGPPVDQLTLFARPEDVAARVIRETDLERLTPIAALNLLQTLKDRLS